MSRDDEEFAPSSSDADYWQSADHGKREALRREIEEQTGQSVDSGDLAVKTELDLLKLQAQLTDDDASDQPVDEAGEEAPSDDQSEDALQQSRDEITEEHRQAQVRQESQAEHQSDAG